MHYTDKKVFNYHPQVEKRKVLRNNLTKAEAALWLLLKGGKLNGKKFRRQHGIEQYIVDFYCPSEKLIIELDGEVHSDPLRSVYDKEREDSLKELGFTILRFENKLIFENAEGVLRTIASAFSQRE